LVGSTTARYDTRAAVQTIPGLVPFTTHENRLLVERQHSHNVEWERPPGSQADTLALFDRWHDWLWSPDRQSRTPNPDGLEFAEGCRRLNVAVSEVISVKLA